MRQRGAAYLSICLSGLFGLVPLTVSSQRETTETFPGDTLLSLTLPREGLTLSAGNRVFTASGSRGQFNDLKRKKKKNLLVHKVGVRGYVSHPATGHIKTSSCQQQQDFCKD